MELDSPEYKTLTQCYPKLFTCVKQSPSDIVAQLRPSGILAPGDLSFLYNSQKSNDEKAQKIIDAVINQVEINPRVFRIFVSALKTAGSWTKTIVLELNNLCISLSDIANKAPHTDSAINIPQIPIDTDNESNTQVAKVLYEEVCAQPTVKDTDIDFDRREGTLERETEHMRRMFAGLICEVINSIKKAKVEVKTLATFLQQIEPINAVLVTARCSSLYFTAEVVQSIENGDIDNVFRELKDYYSWFNFDLIEDIIKEFCKKDDDVKKKLTNYKKTNEEVL